MTADRYFVVRYLLLAYGALAVLAVVARWLPAMSAAGLALAVVVLAVLPAAGLMHRASVRRLERLHQFAPDRWLRRWAVRRFLGQVLSVAVALVLAAVVVLQSPFFGKPEWALLSAAPILFIGCRQAALARVGSLFSRAVYAANGASAVARLLTVVILWTVWLLARRALAENDTRPLAEAVHALQSTWPTTASAVARWAIDAGAWSEATLALLVGTADVAWWRIVLALIFVPLAVFIHAAWSAAGASLDAGGWRRMLGASLGDEAVPPPVSRTRAGGYVAFAAVVAVGTVLAVARADALLAQQPRWLALSAVPQCERIGGRVYSLGTLAKIDAYTAVMDRGIESRRASACARFAEIRRVAERNVDAYLEWYFSLPAEYTRLALMVAGEADAFNELKLAQMVTAEPRFSALMEELRLDNEYILDVASRARNGVTEVLEQQRLVLDARQCRVVEGAGVAAGDLTRYERLRDRTMTSAAAGVVTAMFARTLAKRMTARATTQAATRVAARAAAKGAGRAGSAAAGAAAGSVVPGVGTVAGLVVGTVGADAALLAAEEMLMRPGMRRELLADVDESLAPLRAAFDCPAQ